MMISYDKAEAKKTDRAYQTPDVTRQRMRTLEALQLKARESVLDVGCGSGLLADDMAGLVGPDGRVVGIDASPDMLSRAEEIPEGDDSFDAAACVQVLLYVPDVPAALAEMHRVLKPGGRIAIVETDWRGTVLNSFDDSITRRMLTAWDDAVASPNLPVRLGPLMTAAGFSAVNVEAFPIVNASYTPGAWSMEMLEAFADYARNQGTVNAADSEAWYLHGGKVLSRAVVLPARSNEGVLP
jgi:SAM-dependent methyltransferase